MARRSLSRFWAQEYGARRLLKPCFIHILPVNAHFPFDPNRSTEYADFDITEIYWRKTGKEGLDAGKRKYQMANI